jgi:hypothetical protein
MNAKCILIVLLSPTFCISIDLIKILYQKCHRLFIVRNNACSLIFFLENSLLACIQLSMFVNYFAVNGDYGDNATLFRGKMELAGTSTLRI